jgi:hypothetical protein
LVQGKLAVATWQWACTLLCACPRGVGKTIGHSFARYSTLPSSCSIHIPPPPPAWKKSSVWEKHICFSSVSSTYTKVGRLA